VAVILLALTVPGAAFEPADPVAKSDFLFARLVHPERQAAEFLRFFAGARAASPAAALTAWKRASGASAQLGKPLEAVIALGNPEMAREWRVLDGAELHLGLGPAAGAPHWFAFIPADDGTAAAAITASRLTYPDLEPIDEAGRATPVARLGRSGVPVASSFGQTLVVASSRTDLRRGVACLGRARRPTPRTPEGATASAGAAGTLDSGIVFRLVPGRITIPPDGTASIELAQAVAWLRGAGCLQIDGSIRLQDGGIAIETVSTFEKSQSPPARGGRPAEVELAWLESVPSSGVMAAVSIAIDPTGVFWDSVFALADRVDRVDPGHAGLAPLRTRLNLMAGAAGIPLEADLWPHLHGVTACLIGDAARPGRPIGLLLILHLDADASARGVAREVKALPGSRAAGPSPPIDDVRQPRRLGTALGRAINIWQRGKDVLLAWGDDAWAARLREPVPRERSIAAACGGWTQRGRGGPARVGAFWPGRLWRPAGGLEPSPATVQVLGADPPVVWWGWNEQSQALDSIGWSGLPRRVRQFLDTIPLDPPRAP
jgi:hypothetical protein